ncbi:exodeoxyribonuclease VII small subunit [Knoellia sp. CPCC 206453]|uniref:exodeoxyribonuclease VII small subunit n=1 Tax=Knoellia pratensis TaxID=3404796 RepID=UPI00361806E8
MAKSTPQPEITDAEADVETPATGEVDGADASSDVAEMSYEAARDELVDIVARLENGQVGLEDSMGLWQRGEALAAHCAQWLDAAEAKLSE